MAGQASSAQLTIPKPLRSPLYEFSKGLGQSAPDLYTRPFQTYQGMWNPALSPTLQQTGSFLQGRSVSPAPQVLGQAQGALGGFMSGGMQNPYTTGIGRFTNPAQNLMGPEAVNASRNALFRFQTPQFQNPVRRIKRGYPNYWSHGQQSSPTVSSQPGVSGQYGGINPGGGFTQMGGGFTRPQQPSVFGGLGGPYGTSGPFVPPDQGMAPQPMQGAPLAPGGAVPPTPQQALAATRGIAPPPEPVPPLVTAPAPIPQEEPGALYAGR